MYSGKINAFELASTSAIITILLVAACKPSTSSVLASSSSTIEFSAVLNNSKFSSFFNSWTKQFYPTWPWPQLTRANRTYLVVSTCPQAENRMIHHLSTKYLPVLTGPLDKEARAKNYFIRSVTLISLLILHQYETNSSLDNESNQTVALSPHTEVEAFLEKINKMGSRRWDNFLFVTSLQSLLLNEVYKKEGVLALRNKMGFALDTETVFVDPLVFNKGIPVTIQELEQELNLHKPNPVDGFNLRGRHFKLAGCVDLAPLHFLRSKSPKLEHDGAQYRIFSTTAEKYNFTFETIFEEGAGYGTLLKNGTWTGMIANLIYPERKFDFTVIFGHIYHFYDKFDFVGMTAVAAIQFAQALPSKTEISWQSIFSPYQLKVWLLLGITYLLICVAIFIVLHCKSLIATKGSISRNLYAAIYIPFKISVDQTVLIKFEIRKVIIPWLILMIIASNAYRSVLVSFLTFPAPANIPQTFRQLAARKDYKIMLYALGSIEVELFQPTSPNPIFKEIGSRLELVKYDQPRICSHGAVFQQNTVCIAWFPTTSATFTETGIVTRNLYQQSYQVSKDAAFSTTNSVPFQKNSTLVDSFLPIIARIFDSGIYGQWLKMITLWLKQKALKRVRNSCSDSDEHIMFKELEQVSSDLQQGPIEALKIRNLLVMFLILGIGLLISSLIFTVEYYFKKNINHLNNLMLKSKSVLTVDEIIDQVENFMKKREVENIESRKVSNNQNSENLEEIFAIPEKNIEDI